MKEPWNELDLFASSRSSKGDGDAQLMHKPTVTEPPRVVEVKTVADAPDDVDYLYLGGAEVVRGAAAGVSAERSPVVCLRSNANTPMCEQ
eukprot:7240380-Prymnesium_polylepis.1